MQFVFNLIFVFLVAVNAQNSEERLEVGLYYNSLCGDSAAFIADQLVPAFADFKDYIQLTFVAFGKSFYVDHGDYFMCLGGPDDCYGNTLQLCGLQQITSDEQAQVDFVACEMRRPFNRNVTRPECSEQTGIIWNEVTDCINNGLGKALMLDARQRTHRVAVPHPASVPTIVYNGVFDQQLQNRSIREFATVICELIDNAHTSCTKKLK